MIKIQDLQKRFGKFVALENINIEIEKGKITSIIGPNGSGKTTLIKSILGLVIPTKGKIYIDGVDIKKNYNYREKIGYMPQIANFPENVTVREFFSMMQDIRNKKNEKKLSELIEILDLIPHLNKKIKNLSGGTKQKVNAILSLMFNPDILIFDEPTVGLDPVTAIKLKKIISKEKEEGKTIIFVSHIVNEIESLADNIVFMVEGKLTFAGTIIDLKEKTQRESLEDAIICLLNS
ncbi:ABC transporter ATP-binding protein [Sulfurihydrogenibium subterraneum]|uniref:ABC transporter ATP-binding protein n=1 Tax=Sulfurihydrogenibium subterraneum TaxID=171121 RepID=UPI00048E2713|nr:ABC transporter ATP-binding protein [Sulfurihydrogenibium subterraneum]